MFHLISILKPREKMKLKGCKKKGIKIFRVMIKKSEPNFFEISPNTRRILS